MTDDYQILEPDEDDSRIVGKKEFNIESVIHAQVNRLMYLGSLRSNLRPELRQLERAINLFEMSLRPYWDSKAPFRKKRKDKTEYEKERDKILKEREEIAIMSDKEKYFENLSEHLSLIMCLIDKYNLGLKRVKIDKM